MLLLSANHDLDEQVGGKKSESLHLVGATRVTGDMVAFRDITRRLLVKL